ncbi:MAG TPA: copper resistance CopC family protein [Steroidobacteraceae bacterium]|nr:copper resistance CopC family protein [Steroidobacteraceae bacterium]
MKRRPRAGVWLLLLLCSGAGAHVHLQQSSPADGSRLAAAPATLTLSFSEPAQLTALSLQQDQGRSWKLSAPPEAQLHLSVALPPLAPGSYHLHWRALSRDGHVVPGEIHFSIAP